MADPEASSSSGEPSDIQENDKAEEFIEPEKKRRKICKIPDGKSDKLEQRLGGILCCAVCLDLPRAAVYQCTNGHLMCAGCFTHVLADARLRDEIATCPNCRIEISKTSASRNLAVEKAVNELPSECQFCGKDFPRITLERHEETLCDERITNCKYSRIGCPWRGPFHEAAEHEQVCAHPHRSGAEVMEALQVIDLKCEEEKRLYNCVFDLLSYEKITFNDLQIKPYRTDEFVHKLFYETSRFTAFNNQWVMKARINNSQRDPTQSSERNMTYQLILKTKTTYPLALHYLILRGPFGDMKVNAKIHKFEFTDQENESPYVQLPLADTAECNRLLAAKVINFRLIMFLSSK
ncbi:Cysteine and histidine-rich protein 1-like protein [Cryptotermes secundus]|uniref:Cysteine and histidine-rich protein 1-like protein n=1 Tax=Cryptotermes secundus TaxID=105785 RepID=A0A2J7PHX1_9NEOP|nr:cysteine and histidine-rich protein 1 homolog [Cryptotermes secundus]PNF15935.1 Cysteine and histidine-rich protein 1-like protein [Cryptotermes secundus]